MIRILLSNILWSLAWTALVWFFMFVIFNNPAFKDFLYNWKVCYILFVVFDVIKALMGWSDKLDY